MTASTGAGPVEKYLDEMFDRLAGTGPAGRRMLAEAESHLLAAVDDGRARGLDAGWPLPCLPLGSAAREPASSLWFVVAAVR